MKAVFEDDRERGRGHALLRLTEIQALPDCDCSFSLCRASDEMYLGAQGWQSAEVYLCPVTQNLQQEQLLLGVGPEVVDHLRMNENYRLTLQVPGQALQRTVLAITSISATLLGQSGNVQGYVAPAPVQAAPVVAPEAPAAEAAAPEMVREEGPQSLSMEAPTPSPPQRSLLPWLGLLLLVLVLAGGGWWYMQQQKNDVAAEQPKAADQAEKAEKAEQPASPEPKAEPEPKPEPKAEPEPKPEPKAEKEAPAAQPAGARERVRVFFGGSPTPQAAVELSRSIDASTAEGQDAQYRLHYYAAGEKHVESYAFLARAVDPLKPPCGSIAKDAAEAWAQYAKVATQDADAARDMQALKTWLESEAAKGNKQAVEWIRAISQSSSQRQ